ncbi:hypothetical protein FRC02_011514 [Tulasnella sp. 418]|nr:hypothetical protein FRC02_011514 [Tulasnella sp. 418]
MSKDWKKNNVGELLDQAGLGHTCQYTMDRMRDVAMLEVELVARRHRLVLDWGKIKDRGIPAVTMFHFNDDLTQARLIAIFEGFVIPYNGYTIADTLAAVKTQVRDVFPAKPIYLSSDEQVESIRNISPFICMVDYRKFISSSPTAKYYDYDAVIKGMRGA